MGTEDRKPPWGRREEDPKFDVIRPKDPEARVHVPGAFLVGDDTEAGHVWPKEWRSFGDVQLDD